MSSLIAMCIQLLYINSVSVTVFVFGSQVLLQVDTGAAVSLISSEVWNHIKPIYPPEFD